MTTDLTPTGLISLDAARAFARASKAPATLRAYNRQWAKFAQWAAAHQAQSLPASPALVSAYLAHLAQSLAFATVMQARAAIGFAHRTRREVDPTADGSVALVVDGIARTIGTAAAKPAMPMSALEVQQVLDSIAGDDLPAVRDRALVAVAFVSAMRVSEITAMRGTDLDWRLDGALYRLRRSKTDQTGAGRLVAIAAGPATVCLRAWLDALAQFGQFAAAPVWIRLDGSGRRLSAVAVSEVIARRCSLAGVVGRRTGHSMRAGHVTEAAERGATALKIAGQTGHKSVDMVLRYTRPVDALRESTGRGLL